MNKDKNVFWVSIALFLGSFLFCLSFINEGLFHCDSVILAKAVEDTYRTGHLHSAVSGRYGSVIINTILYFPFYLLGQNADFLTRLSSVFFYALSIPAFFIFINVLFKDRIQGLFAAILLAFTPFYLIPNTYGKEHGMCMFFFLCSMILVNRGTEEKRPAALAWASVCYIISLSVRESVLFMFPFYLWLYFKPVITFRPFGIHIQNEKLDGRLLLFFVLPLVALFSFMMITYWAPLIQSSLNGEGIFVPHFCGIWSEHLSQAFQDVRGSFPGWFLFLGILGIGIVWQERRYFLLFFFLAWACLIFIYGNFDIYSARHLDMAILALHAFVSCFLATLYRRFHVLTIYILVFLITMQVIHFYPILEFNHRYDGTLRLASLVKSITPPNAVFIAVDEAPFIEYYGKRKTVIFPIGHWERLDNFFHEIDSLLDRQVDVYLIPASYVYFAGGTVAKSHFFEASPNGHIILTQLIKEGILKDISLKEVSFQLNNELKIKAMRRIAGGNFDKIWSILQQACNECHKKIGDRYRFYKVGEVLVEDFHRPELEPLLYMMPVFKVEYFGFTKATSPALSNKAGSRADRK